jgi:hypothetical protein
MVDATRHGRQCPPIDCAPCEIGIAMSIYVQSEFWKMVSIEGECVSEGVLTVVTNKVLILARAEHAHWTT